MKKENLVSGDRALTLWFAPDAPDLAYVDLTDWAFAVAYLITDENGTYELNIVTEADERTVTMTRENQYTAKFDFAKGTDWTPFSRAIQARTAGSWISCWSS